MHWIKIQMLAAHLRFPSPVDMWGEANSRRRNGTEWRPLLAPLVVLFNLTLWYKRFVQPISFFIFLCHLTLKIVKNILNECKGRPEKLVISDSFFKKKLTSPCIVISVNNEI